MLCYVLEPRRPERNELQANKDIYALEMCWRSVRNKEASSWLDHIGLTPRLLDQSDPYSQLSLNHNSSSSPTQPIHHASHHAL